MADTLQPGDVVTLKSHPDYPMTIEWINSGETSCAWFHPVTGDYQQRLIYASALVKIR